MRTVLEQCTLQQLPEGGILVKFIKSRKSIWKFKLSFAFSNVSFFYSCR